MATRESTRSQHALLLHNKYIYGHNRTNFIQTVVDYRFPSQFTSGTLLQKYFLHAFLSEKAHHLLGSTPSACALSETTGNERIKIILLRMKNQSKPWPSRFICSLGFLLSIIRCRHTAVLLKYDE